MKYSHQILGLLFLFSILFSAYLIHQHLELSGDDVIGSGELVDQDAYSQIGDQSPIVQTKEFVLQETEFSQAEKLEPSSSRKQDLKKFSSGHASSAHSQSGTYSPALDQLVGEEQLRADIRAWEQNLEAQGLVRYFNGGPSYPLFGESSQNNLNSEYLSKTVEELVALAQNNDPSAMLALANRAWSAGLWEEGDVYAMYAARISGSSDPLLHGASQRLSQSPLGYRDRESASWFLAAYLQGNLAAAMLVEAYFSFMSVEDQYWAADRAGDLLDQIHNGG